MNATEKREMQSGTIDGHATTVTRVTPTQTAIPGTTKRKRRSVLEQAIAGDLIITFATVAGEPPAGIAAIEQVSDSIDGSTIVERWADQGVNVAKIEIWEQRPGGYYRRRRAGR